MRFLDPDEPDDLEPESVGPDHPLWRQDNVSLLSVGIDIGTASTQVALSRLHLQRSSIGLTSRFVVVERDNVFESALTFTPYGPDGTIDAAALGAILDEAYDSAGARPDQIDTGAVLITGDAMRKVNAARISETVSSHAGDFVCAAAGHHMEAELAAHSSGAVRLSRECQATILNVDIGGGTAKFAIVSDGNVLSTAALHVGARHVVVAGGEVVVLEESGPAGPAGMGWFTLGGPLETNALEDAADWIADLVLDVATGKEVASDAARWWLTEPIGDVTAVDSLVFSGGVGEYVYGLETEDFGDLGLPIGRALRDRLGSGDFPLTVWAAAERIRATVLGAAGYTVQLSGLTTFATGGFALPSHNVPVVRARYDATQRPDAAVVAAAIRARLSARETPQSDPELAVALAWSGRAEHARLMGLATGIREGLRDRFDEGLPTILILEADIAMTLGRILSDELGVRSPLLVLDGLHLTDFDFIDVGSPEGPSMAMPVVVKSLVFRDGSAVR